MKKEYKVTRKIIADMLRERVSHSILDSGGAYGRHHERNTKLGVDEWEKSSPAIVRFSQYGIDTSVNLYHYLVHRLSYAPWLQEMLEVFDQALQAHDEGDLDWFATIEYFTKLAIPVLASFPEMGKSRLSPTTAKVIIGNDEYLARLCSQAPRIGMTLATDVVATFCSMMRSHTKARRKFIETVGDSGTDVMEVVNTYNHENELSQVYQRTVIQIGDYYFAAIFIHGGCDVRGGYTAPKMFEMTHGLDDDQEIGLYCTNGDCNAHWDFRNGREECNEFDWPVVYVDTDDLRDPEFLEVNPEIQAQLEREVQSEELARHLQHNQVPPGFPQPEPNKLAPRDFWEYDTPERGMALCPHCRKGTIMADAPYPSDFYYG